MGKLQKFEIEFDHPQAVYRAGELLRGKVVVNLKEPMKMRSKLLSNSNFPLLSSG